ncbi:MAG TPA: GxGYxYP domain-containing protein, partial [Ktedonobacteraceae bacterium]
MNIGIGEANADWAGLWPTLQAPDHLDVYDLRGASQDVQLSVTTMTGVINRQQPRVYLLSSDDAAFWLNEALAQVPHDVSPATGNDALEALLISYGSSIRGLIIYDPNCMDSINIATMLAGQRDGMVVSPAQAAALQGPPHQLPVLADLRIYQWKNRIQAYTWAEGNLLKSAAPNLVAGLDPKIPGALRSFLVATRTFIYWLDARKCLPDILNGWISECGLMQRIFNAFPAGTIHLGWFVDEGQGVRLTSKAAVPVLASDYFNNLEVWTSVQNVQGVGQEQGVSGQVENLSKAEDLSRAEDLGQVEDLSRAG